MLGWLGVRFLTSTIYIHWLLIFNDFLKSLKPVSNLIQFLKRCFKMIMIFGRIIILSHNDNIKKNKLCGFKPGLYGPPRLPETSLRDHLNLFFHYNCEFLKS